MVHNIQSNQEKQEKSVKSRMYWIDNLRIFLCILVVVYHSARAYGLWSGYWFVKEEITSPLITPFFAINAAFLMSIFFFLSAYFMPPSYDKKGSPKFGDDRSKKMLIPLIFFILVVMPIEVYVYYEFFMVGTVECTGCTSMNFFQFFGLIYFGIGGKPTGWDSTVYPNWPAVNLGHIWFLEHLLIYGLFYVLYKKNREKRELSKLEVKNKIDLVQLRPERIQFPSNIKIFLSTFILGLASFIVRIFYPLNDWGAFLYFYQVEWAHFPHYIFVVIMGVAAYRHKWLEGDKLSKKAGLLWLIIGITCSISLLVLNLFIPLNDNSLQGGFSILPFLYSLVESFLMVGFLIGFISIFKQFFNKSNHFIAFLSKNSYIVYLVHQPIVVIIQYLLLPYGINLVIKWGIVALLSIPFSFLFAAFIRKIVPYAKKYL